MMHKIKSILILATTLSVFIACDMTDKAEINKKKELLEENKKLKKENKELKESLEYTRDYYDSEINHVNGIKDFVFSKLFLDSTLKVQFNSDNLSDRIDFVRKISSRKGFSDTTISNRYSEYGYPYSVGWYYRTFVWYDGGIRYGDLPMLNLSDEDIALTFLMKSIDRSPENIEKLFQKYEPAIHTVIDDFFYRWNMGGIINNLLHTYQEIQDKKYISKFNKIKEAEKNRNITPYSFMMEEIYGPPEERGFRKAPKNGKEPMEKHFSYRMWTYTFWYRRHEEGNMEVVFKILKKLKAHYEK